MEQTLRTNDYIHDDDDDDDSERKNHSEDLGIDGNTVLKWIIKERCCEFGSSGSLRGPEANFLERSNESSVYMKG
jgi:hypothetical protein